MTSSLFIISRVSITLLDKLINEILLLTAFKYLLTLSSSISFEYSSALESLNSTEQSLTPVNNFLIFNSASLLKYCIILTNISILSVGINCLSSAVSLSSFLLISSLSTTSPDNETSSSPSSFISASSSLI